MTRSSESSTARTASFWPLVRRVPSSRFSTVSPFASAMPFPRPARIAASTRRSAFTARSVTKARSMPRRSTSISSPPLTRRPIAASTSASVYRPGAWPSATARISASGSTVRRSLACDTARATASSTPSSGSRDSSARLGERSSSQFTLDKPLDPSRGSRGSAGARFMLRIALAGRSGGGMRGGLTRSPVNGSMGRGGASAVFSRVSPSARAFARHSGTSSARPMSCFRRRVCSAAICASSGV